MSVVLGTLYHRLHAARVFVVDLVDRPEEVATAEETDDPVNYNVLGK